MPRPKDYTLATSAASDDFLLIDGTTNGTRRLSASSPAVSDLILGTSGPSVKATLSARAPRQGLVFDGSGGAATFTAASIGSGDFTAAAFITATSFGSNGRVILNGTNFEFGLLNTGAIYIYNGTTTLSSTGTLTAGKSTLVTYTKSGTSGTFYINGVSAGGVNDSLTYGSVSGVGGNNSVSGMLGTIAPYLQNRALSASEVVALYEAGAPAANDIPGTAAGTVIGNQAAVNASGLTSFSSSSGQFSGTTNSTGAFYVRFSTGRINTGNLFRITGTVSYGGAYPLYGGVTQQGSGTGQAGIPIVNGNFDVVITAHSYQPTGFIDFYIGGVNGVSWTITNITITPLGLLLAPDAAQAGGGLTWYDTSGNAANITLPASGVSWNVPSSRVLGGNWTTSGNLTVSGTGTSSVAGNLNIGEPTGSGYRLYVKAGFGLALGGSYIECGEYDKPCSILNHTNPSVSANLFQIQKQGSGVFTVSSAGNLTVSGGSVSLNALTGNPPQFRHHPVGTADIIAGVNGIRFLNNAASAAGMSLDANNDTTLTGNLTVSGKGTFSNTSASTPTIALNTTQTSTGLSFLSTIGGAPSSERNWAILTNAGAYGDFVIRSSNAQGGNPITAGTTALTIDNSNNATFAGTVKVKNQATLNANGSVAVGTSATTIFSALNTSSANWAFVFGDDGSSGFADLVVTVGNGAAVVVISSATIYGSPPARTYTSNSTNLQLALASGSLTVRTTSLTPGT